MRCVCWQLVEPTLFDVLPLVRLWAFEGFMARCDSAANRFQMPPVWEPGSRVRAKTGKKHNQVWPIAVWDVLHGYTDYYEYTRVLKKKVKTSRPDIWQTNTKIDMIVGAQIKFLQSFSVYYVPLYSCKYCSTHPPPRHGVHGLSRTVQHICCWHHWGPTYGSTLSLQAGRWGSEQNLPAPQWPTIRENCQQEHLRSQTTSTDKCLHFSM